MASYDPCIRPYMVGLDFVVNAIVGFPKIPFLIMCIEISLNRNPLSCNQTIDRDTFKKKL